MGAKHYKKVEITLSQGGVMVVNASGRDGFAPYSVKIDYGVLYVYLRGNLIAAASQFVFQTI